MEAVSEYIRKKEKEINELNEHEKKCFGYSFSNFCIWSGRPENCDTPFQLGGTYADIDRFFMLRINDKWAIEAAAKQIELLRQEGAIIC